MNTSNITGSCIKLLRKEEDINQKECAKRLLVSQSYLSGVESGSVKPTSKLIRLIALEFGVREDWLLTGEGEVYDDYHEDNRETANETSNSALLEYMKLLGTKSNIKFSAYANLFYNVTSTMTKTDSLDGDGSVYLLKLYEKLHSLICGAINNSLFCPDKSLVPYLDQKNLKKITLVILEIQNFIGEYRKSKSIGEYKMRADYNGDENPIVKND